MTEHNWPSILVARESRAPTRVEGQGWPAYDLLGTCVYTYIHIYMHVYINIYIYIYI
jgi:hypothetical protein